MQGILTLLWILDIINLPQLKCLDTTYPINTLAWWLIWIFIIGSRETTHYLVERADRD